MYSLEFKAALFNAARAAILATGLIPFGHAIADEPVPRTVQSPRNDKLEPRVGPVHLASKAIGRSVKNSAGELVGKIEGVGLDIGKGRVASFLMQPAGQRAGLKESRPVSPESLAWSDKSEDLLISSPLAETPPVPKEPDAVSQVMVVSAAPNVAVVDKNGDKLGKIVDFALSPRKGEIAYAILKLQDDAKSKDRRYPIPLAAFVVKTGSNDWVLELPEGILQNTPAFEDKALPETVSRAWTEYVRVRYGRSPQAGVRRETAADGKAER